MAVPASRVKGCRQLPQLQPTLKGPAPAANGTDLSLRTCRARCELQRLPPTASHRSFSRDEIKRGLQERGRSRQQVTLSKRRRQLAAFVQRGDRSGEPHRPQLATEREESNKVCCFSSGTLETTLLRAAHSRALGFASWCAAESTALPYASLLLAHP